MAATPDRVLKVGIVGLGHLHPRSYMALFKTVAQTQVVAVCEANAALREPFCKDFGIKGYATLAELLAAEKLEIAAIFLPHVDCPEAAEACAGKGIHLMVEKPMASSAAGARRIVEVARKNGVQLTTGYAWRLHPVARELKKLIQDGSLGRIVGAEGAVRRGSCSGTSTATRHGYCRRPAPAAAPCTTWACIGLTFSGGCWKTRSPRCRDGT